MTGKSFEPDYLVALDEIFHAHWSAERRMRINLLREAVARLWPDGHPTRLMQIAGTSGKGSVTHYLAQGLRAFGRTGSWTGPHSFDYAERFHINGEVADHGDLARIYHQRLCPLQDHFTRNWISLGFEELGILMALCLFEEHRVDWGLMEVFSGGRYSPLMALPMAACLLTNIGEDHMDKLGREPWQRSLEKAGIARKAVPFLTTAEGECRQWAIQTAAAAGAEIHAISAAELETVQHLLPEPLPQHVVHNLTLAVAAIRRVYPEAEVGALLASMPARLPARFWRVEPRVIADVAHNADKINALIDELCLAFPGYRFVFVLGLTRNRDPRSVFARLLEVANRIIVTSASHAGQNPVELGHILGEFHGAVSVEPIPRIALDKARQALTEDEVLVVTGSTYTVDQALNPNAYLREVNGSSGRRYKKL